MTKTFALALVVLLTLATTVPAVAQSGSQWKPEVKFIKIGVSSAGGDWFRRRGRNIRLWLGNRQRLTL